MPKRLFVQLEPCAFCLQPAAFLGRLRGQVRIELPHRPDMATDTLAVCKSCRLDLEIGDHTALVERVARVLETHFGLDAATARNELSEAISRAVIDVLQRQLWSWEDIGDEAWENVPTEEGRG